MGDFKDALIYSGISTQQFNDTNIRIPSTVNNKGGNASFFTVADGKYVGTTTRGTAFTNFKAQTGTSTTNDLNKLINDTTIKRACCLQNKTDDNLGYKVKVKLPYVAEVVDAMTDVDGTTKADWKRLGFMTKEVVVPITMCSNIDGVDYTINTTIPGTYDKCDKFMISYCENAKHLYNLDLSGMPFVDADFMVTTPECGCHIDRPLNFKASVQPACYAGTWCFGNTSAYKDTGTRTSGACKIQECTSVMNLGDWNSVMGAAITDNKFQNFQTCFDADKAYNLVKQEGLTPDEATNAVSDANKLRAAQEAAAKARAEKAAADKIRADKAKEDAAAVAAADAKTKEEADKRAQDEADKIAKEEADKAEVEGRIIKSVSNTVLYGGIAVILLIIIAIVAFFVLRGKSDSAAITRSPAKRR